MSDGDLLHGVEFKEQYSLRWPFTQQMRDISGAASQLTQDATDIAPTDANASLVKVYDLATIQTQLDAFKLVFPGKINLNLPAQLQSITLVTESQAANGSNNPSGYVNVADLTIAYQAQIGGDSEAQSSGALMSDLSLNWAEVSGTDKLCTHFSCFVAIPDDGILTRAAVLTKIKTLVTAWSSLSLDWPKFNPVAHTIVLTGNAVSIRAGASAFASRYFTPEQQVDQGKLDENKYISRQVTVKSVNIPPCIHGAITIGSAPTPVTVAVSVSNVIAGSATDDISVGPVAISTTVSGQLSPTSLAATSGQATTPSSGLYVKELDVAVYAFDYALISGTVFDFADL